jgi:plastocyanin
MVTSTGAEQPMPRIRIVQDGGKAVFEPATMVIPVNERVFWLNDDNQEHLISLTGETLNPGKTSSEVVITARRTYSCFLHPEETGTIEIGGVV